MKKRAVSWILTLAFCLSMLPTAALAAQDENEISVQVAGDVTIYPDEADANGNIIASNDIANGGTNFKRTGPVYKGSDGDATLEGGIFYIVQGNVTIGGNLMIGGDAYGGLVLCKGATLTVKGALIHTGGNAFTFTDNRTTGKTLDG